MKALVYTRPGVVAYREEPDPTPGTGEALIKVEAVGICGSDMHGYLGHDARRVPPLILGHEVCGRVVSGQLQGRRVVANPLVTCGRCDDCVEGRTNLCKERVLIGMARPGAFADLLTIAEQNLVVVPDTTSPQQMALGEPAATALHAVRLCAEKGERSIADSRALVLGGGAIGILAALELHRQGCKEIFLAEINALRRATAAHTGVCETFDPSDEATVNSVTEREFDVVIDAVGATATRELAIAAVKSGGVLCHTGLLQGRGDFDFRKLTLSEVTLVGTYTYTAADFRAAVTALCKEQLGDLQWVEQRPLSEGAAAFEDLHAGRTAAAKIVLCPESSANAS